MSVQPGADTPTEGSMSPTALSNRVVTHLTERGVLAPISLVRVTDLIRSFANYLLAAGVGSSSDITEAHVTAFIRSLTRSKAEPSVATMHLRRTALRILFREAKVLGLLSADPTTDMELPPRSYRELRPLTDAEIERCRSFAEGTKGEPRHVTAWALAEATARVAELGAVRTRDIDLGGGRVWISGSSQTEARWSELTEWGTEQLRQVIPTSDASPAHALLVPRGASRASVHEVVASTLRQAGLAKTPGVRPNSIPAWRGTKEFVAGASIDEVARLLGMRSLDRAASFIGFDWRAGA